MTLVQLRHLIALADSGSFSKASQAVHLTQPALSRSVRALESELGLPLVDRVGRRLELTPMGRDVLARARQLVSDAKEMQAHTLSLARGQAGALRVGLGSGPGVMLMTPLLLEVAARRQQWRVEVARGTTELLVQRLRARTLDALVVDVRSLAPDADLQVGPVCEMRGAFMVRRGHPLARRRAVRFDDLRAYPLASTPLSDAVAHTLMERYGPQAHPDHAVSVRCDEIASLVDVATQSDAVLLAIRASAPKLAELRMSPPLDATARLGLVTLARRSQPPALEMVRTLMASRLGGGKSGHADPDQRDSGVPRETTRRSNRSAATADGRRRGRS
jgi:DNA-binding transcriptional LysR family regulator